MVHKFIDAHCHLFDFYERNTLQVELKNAQYTSHFLGSALGEDEYEWFDKLNLPNINFYAGVHPFYEKSSEKLLPKLIELAEKKKIIGIGEIGLDKRNSDFDRQKKMLLTQLDIASQFDLPVVFHIVGMYYELHKILKNSFPQTRGMLHGFHGSLEIAKIFPEMLFSIGCRFPKEDALQFIVEQKRFCLETDAPYQKPLQTKDSSNHLSNITVPVSKITQISNLGEDDIATIQEKNIKQLFGVL
jgi:TatD DNase family protein